MNRPAATSEISGPDRLYSYYVLAILTLIFVFSIADRMVMSILIEDIRTEFSLNDTSVGLLAGLAFTMFYVFLGIPIARLADQWNRKTIIAIAISLWSIMTVACGAATSFATLFLARTGVGIGEAGGNPPSVSIIADYFRPTQLARAMGIFSMGATIGTVLALVVGGYIAGHYGWRSVFLALGTPGLILGGITFLTVREPPRGRFAPIACCEDQEKQPIWRDIAVIFTNAAYLRTMLAMTAAMTCAYAFAIWFAPAILRNFDKPVAKVGQYLGIAYAAGGIPGLLIGGYLADSFSGHSVKWRAWIGALATAIAAPFLCGSLFVDDFFLMIVLYAIGFGFLASVQATSLAVTQSSVAPNRRALAASILLVFTNVIGQGLSPLVVGALSDHFQESFGTQSLNLSIMIASLVCLITATLLYLWAAPALQASQEPAASGP